MSFLPRLYCCANTSLLAITRKADMFTKKIYLIIASVALVSCTNKDAKQTCYAEHDQLLAQMSDSISKYASGCSSPADCILVDDTISCQTGNLFPIVVDKRIDAVASLRAVQDLACPTLDPTCGVAGQTPYVK